MSSTCLSHKFLVRIRDLKQNCRGYPCNPCQVRWRGLVSFSSSSSPGIVVALVLQLTSPRYFVVPRPHRRNLDLLIKVSVPRQNQDDQRWVCFERYTWMILTCVENYTSVPVRQKGNVRFSPYLIVNDQQNQVNPTLLFYGI